MIARHDSPRSFGPRQRGHDYSARIRIGSRDCECSGRAGGLRYFLRCLILLRIRRFLRPTLRRPLPRRRLAMRSPLGCRESIQYQTRTVVMLMGLNENIDSTRKSVIISRSVGSRDGRGRLFDCLCSSIHKADGKMPIKGESGRTGPCMFPIAGYFLLLQSIADRLERASIKA
jgi:hypothetical protein